MLQSWNPTTLQDLSPSSLKPYSNTVLFCSTTDHFCEKQTFCHPLQILVWKANASSVIVLKQLPHKGFIRNAHLF
jgi:hypothetical protein